MFIISLLTGRRARILKVTRIWAGRKQKRRYNVEIGLVMRGSVACEFLYFLAVFIVCNLDKSMFSYKVDREGVLSFRLYNLTSIKMFEFRSELVGWGDRSLRIRVFTSGMPDKVSAICF